MLSWKITLNHNLVFILDSCQKIFKEVQNSIRKYMFCNILDKVSGFSFPLIDYKIFNTRQWARLHSIRLI